MIKLIIIEDETHVSNHLKDMLKNISEEITIVQVIESVKEGNRFFKTAFEGDLILSDIQLTDGLSFDIFKQNNITIPVIFITSYNEFILNAFKHNAIDYLLKPVSEDTLLHSLRKYKSLENHFSNNQAMIKTLINFFDDKKKSRLLAKKGIDNFPLKLEDIVVIHSENKISFAIDSSGRKYMLDKSLSELEYELDDKTFFRVSRQYILNINYIKSYKQYERVKILVELTVPDFSHIIIVSQDTAIEFRKWMQEL
jgi:DNA-binding LytR/AlgR family response regulator